MTRPLADYFSAARAGLARVEQQTPLIEQVAIVLADALASGHAVLIFGTGHSHLVAEDMYYRAGGLRAVRACLEPALMLHEGPAKSSALERLPGYADVLVEQSGVGPGDVVIVVSNSGRNAVPVEYAESAKARGCTVLAITSVQHSQSVGSRAPSGRRLLEVADLVLDNATPPGDATVRLPGLDAPVGALSTVTGSALVQALTVETARVLTGRDLHPDVLTSNNVDRDAS